ncbi:S-adenosyl-L-methionine-dependent methyltransferase [Mrakia frigida]|uniref:class I SAM-dependent methyltransferase n=1 Tax=Mrakia frigida TaxID=29902 RepID=UPI003FCBF5BE
MLPRSLLRHTIRSVHVSSFIVPRSRITSPLLVRFNSSSSPSRPPPSLDVDTTLSPSPEPPKPGEELAHIIRQTIDATGPMPLSRYMTLALSHATLGYYTRGDVFGRKGDFITSPEISQVFGELLAIYFLTRWQANGSPSKVKLLELGPGRGTLMADVLRTFKSFPALSKSITTIDLVETSPVMQAMQKVALEKVGLPEGVEVRWFDWMEEVPKDPSTFTLFLAHEFFDALPIHLFEQIEPTPPPAPTSTSSTQTPTQPSSSPSPSPPKPEFRELLVTYTPPSPTLHLTLSPTPTPASIFLPTTSPHFDSIQIGERVEICPAAAGIMKVLGELIAEGEGGSGLVVDYGKAEWTGNSFRAFKSHSSLSPFTSPGTSDLTANVDFTYLTSLLPRPTSSSLSSSSTFPRILGPIPQAQFLHSMGLGPRINGLIDAAGENEKAKDELWSGAKRLVDGGGMGEEYVVLGVERGRSGAKEDGEEQEVYPFLK